MLDLALLMSDQQEVPVDPTVDPQSSQQGQQDQQQLVSIDHLVQPNNSLLWNQSASCEQPQLPTHDNVNADNIHQNFMLMHQSQQPVQPLISTNDNNGSLSSGLMHPTLQQEHTIVNELKRIQHQHQMNNPSIVANPPVANNNEVAAMTSTSTLNSNFVQSQPPSFYMPGSGPVTSSDNVPHDDTIASAPNASNATAFQFFQNQKAPTTTVAPVAAVPAPMQHVDIGTLKQQAPAMPISMAPSAAAAAAAAAMFPFMFPNAVAAPSAAQSTNDGRLHMAQPQMATQPPMIQPQIMAAAAAALAAAAAAAQPGGMFLPVAAPTPATAAPSEMPLPSPHSLFHRDGSRRMRGGVIEPFPEKLHRLLLEVEAAGRGDVISFVASGRAFCIHKPDQFFKDIVPLYFRQSRLSSFKRQLNLYGFELINTGPARGGYYHELFIKEQPDLCRRMRRVAVKVVNKDSSSTVDEVGSSVKQDDDTSEQQQQHGQWGVGSHVGDTEGE